MAATGPDPEPESRPNPSDDHAPDGHAPDGAAAPPPYVGRAQVPAKGRASVGPPAAEAPFAGPPMARAVPPGPKLAIPAGVRRQRSRWRKVALIGGLSLLLVVVGLATVSYLWLRGVDSGLKRTDAFEDVANRPAKVVEGTINILLLGSDSRDPDAPTDEGSKWRTDTMILMHIPASHDKAYLISFPRDLWVHIPRSKDGKHGDTMAKLNAAYAWGGVPLTVQTIEEYTNVRIDNYALIDFGGFVKVTDALGGVDMYIERTVTSRHTKRVFTKGWHHLSGAAALDYCRQRYAENGVPDGDFGRMRHQQQFLKAVLDRAVSRGTLANPATIKAFITTVAGTLTVDRDFSLLDMAWQFHSLRSQNLIFLTSPHRGTGNIDGESVVVPDPIKAKALFSAIAADQMDSWYAHNSPSPKPSG